MAEVHSEEARRHAHWPKVRSRVIALALALYIGSYFALSRYSLWYHSGTGLQGFLYTPVSPETIDRHFLFFEKLHAFLVFFYYPVWAFDYCVLGGPYWGYFPLPKDFLDWSGVHPEN